MQLRFLSRIFLDNTLGFSYIVLGLAGCPPGACVFIVRVIGCGDPAGGVGGGVLVCPLQPARKIARVESITLNVKAFVWFIDNFLGNIIEPTPSE